MTAGAVVHAERGGAAPEISRVREALRPGVMRPRLLDALGLSRGACQVLDAKYEPGFRCTVLYAVGPHRVRGDVAVGGWPGAAGSGARLPGAARRVVVPGVALSVFPADPGLPALAAVTDPRMLCAAIHELAPGARQRTRAQPVRLLRYRPGRRATLLAAAGDPYVVKVYHDPGKALAVAQESVALQEALGSAAGPLRLATTIGILPGMPAVLQRAVRGHGLDQLLGSPRGRAAGLADAVRAAAQAMAALHRAPVTSRRLRPVDAELRRFRSRAARVGCVDPAAGAPLAMLADRLIGTQPPVPGAIAGLVHGDCKPSQFRVHDGAVTLLDFDHCGVADPASDVGNFLASLRQAGVRGRFAVSPGSGRPGLLEALAATFLRAYLDASEHAPAGPFSTRAGWYEAVALERKALRAYSRSPDSILPTLLAREAHRVLDRVFGGQP
jgi:aminoglycoside phosphotransferase (APT) family kinase protein